jgi:hypothetical protein
MTKRGTPMNQYEREQALHQAEARYRVAQVNHELAAKGLNDARERHDQTSHELLAARCDFDEAYAALDSKTSTDH